MAEPKVLTAEASGMGWAPGFWPKSFAHEGRTFVRYEDVVTDGELVCVKYFADGPDGRAFRLIVFND